MEKNFFNLYRHNFIRIAVGVPEVRVADPIFNARQMIAQLELCAQQSAVLAVFPELGLTGYTCEDLFRQQCLLDGATAALAEVVKASEQFNLVAIVGLPLRVDGLLFNCAAVIHRGRILGVTPKTYPPNYREFYELRHFAPGNYASSREIRLLGQEDIPFGTNLVFQDAHRSDFAFAVEICEDLWSPIPPSCFAALAGATVLCNLSASNITTGKAQYRAQLVSNQSGRCIAAYAYCAAGYGESTTDLAWDGQAMIYENGTRLAETPRFTYKAQMAFADVDLDRLTQDRLCQTSFGQSMQNHAAEVRSYRRIGFALEMPTSEILLLDRAVERFPYVPNDMGTRDIRCREVYEIQVQGLVKRLRAVGTDKVVIGISGGLDSTQALIVCARAMDVLGVSRRNILAYTMPGFATSDRTLRQAWRLMEALECNASEIDIRTACMQMLRDIEHPYALNQPVYDVTFENVQAGERTSHLFRLANLHNALVVGTGDLSELGLGWCTYGVGDQMAHYAVNASVPKTLIQYLIRYEAATGELGKDVSAVLAEVLETEISPELIPGNQEEPVQRTEAVIGPYELQDFNLYYTLRFGMNPPKVAFMEYCAWRHRERGSWPEIPEDRRNEYSIGQIKHWLGVFLKRFFETSQYKRSAIPNAPKVGSGGSLSPRGDWRAPSDNSAALWLEQLQDIPDFDPHEI